MKNNLKAQLNFLIVRSNNLYKEYLENPIYLYALLLKNNNKKIISLLLRKGYLFEDIKNTNTLLSHFEIWLIQFKELENKKFQLDDIFKFESIKYSIPYPTNEIKKILL